MQISNKTSQLTPHHTTPPRTSQDNYPRSNTVKISGCNFYYLLAGWSKPLIFALAFFLILPAVNAQQDCFPEYECGEWEECESGLQSRVCEDVKCGRREIVERSFCEKLGCKPKIECDDWSQCFYTEKNRRSHQRQGELRRL